MLSSCLRFMPARIARRGRRDALGAIAAYNQGEPRAEIPGGHERVLRPEGAGGLRHAKPDQPVAGRAIFYRTRSSCSRCSDAASIAAPSTYRQPTAEERAITHLEQWIENCCIVDTP
jgi:hypothetical protein